MTQHSALKHDDLVLRSANYDEDHHSFDQPFHDAGYNNSEKLSSYLAKESALGLQLANGKSVRGLFRERATLRGLVYLPGIDTWFSACWSLQGKCLTPGCDLGWTLHP